MTTKEESYCKFSIDHLPEVIYTLSNSVRQLSLTALDLQAAALSKKNQIEKALDNVNDLEDVISKLICLLEQGISRFDFKEGHNYSTSQAEEDSQ